MFVCVELKVVLLLNKAIILDLCYSPLGVASARPLLLSSLIECLTHHKLMEFHSGGKCYAG